MVVVGQFIAVHPSRWDTPSGKLPDTATIELVSENRWSIFTDSEFKISQYLKGNTKAPIIRIRTFQGEVGQDKVIASDEPIYEVGKEYLLFLFIDDGPTSSVSPGAYYGTSSPYEILDNKAKSNKDEWLLEDLIAYIEKSLSGEVSLPTSTPIPTEPVIETPLPFTDTPVTTDLPTETPTATETASPTP